MPTITATRTVDFDTYEALRQMRAWDVAAVCGGRVRHGNDVLEMVCGNGYRVHVRLGADDLYVVQRVFVRGGKTFIKGEQDRVFGGQPLSDAVYRAGMFRDSWPAGGIA